MNNHNPNSRSLLTGVDVSNHQGNIDWQRVSETEISFVFIKASEGASFVDKEYEANANGAREFKIPYGAYHFFKPKVPVKDQVQNFVNVVKKLKPGNLRPVLDLEAASEWTHISPSKRIQMIMQWADGVSNALHCEPILYMSPSFATDVLGESEQLAKFALWLAHYTDAPAPRVPRPWSDWVFWQYSNRGRLEGIETAVDLDLFNGSAAQLSSYLIS